MEVSHYHAEGIEESLPRYGTDQTRTMKQKLERNTLLLSYLENSDFDMQQNRLPPITTKEVTARTCMDPPRTEASHYHASGIVESLPRYGTAQTREIKQKLERNKLLLSYEDNFDFDMQPKCLPPITTKAVTARRCLDPPRREASHYHASGIEESLPRYGTTQTREIKQKLERNKLLLSYEDNFDFDMQPKRLPPITTKAVTARRCLDPPRTEASHYHASGIEESLPRYGTAQSRAIKQNIERNQLRLSYEDTIEVRQQATPLPPITTTDKTECLVPAGMEAYQYRPKSVEELLPRCGSAQTRALKHELEDIKLLLSYLDNSDVDMQPTNLLPVTTKNVDAERCLDPAGIEASHCHANGIQESLPGYGTAQSRAIKQKLEGNKLHLTYEDNIKVRQKPTPLPPITTTNETECLVPAGMESCQYCPESVEELLPRSSSAQTRAIKQKLEENKLLLLPYQECSDVDMRPTRPLTVTTKKVDARRFLDPAGIEASQYHANGIEESLPRYGTAQTRAMKQKMEGNEQLLSYQENTKGYKQATRLPPISTKKTTVGRCLDPAGIEASHGHAEGVKESLPKYKTPQTRAIKKKLEETRKVNLLPKHLPPFSKKEAPAGPHCPPRVPEGSNYFFEQTGEQLPRYGTAQTRCIKQRQDQNKLFLG
ncbi:23-bisphosphoglycerate-dependent phosphoglycerate mutase [Dissostichus eleginoides]|uniref:23-bisphosphoglycerate-dependent phosphoglycerate mutase n=1 Tax=Dissostichus eleginoides TaxID=100907 RepID=A0AAD9EUE9_DISEL|nr:23-bisphosphoglycerate-dependent phosphoglycerate mutase [Dissostichus eleginoides]